ncbi:winged helix-turn-helix transcriptional regulator [Microbacterium hominis]|uniref:winged helix-turn-helix transcriptional regulator n=1 Tax=Microbacterium hominis TaxID=162426 RepID=UPI00349F8455
MGAGAGRQRRTERRAAPRGAAQPNGAPEPSGVREVLARVGDKWTLLVVATLRGGRLRFSELQRHIPGISQRMLTLTVRQLERDGLVSRTVHAEVPPRRVRTHRPRHHPVGARHRPG